MANERTHNQGEAQASPLLSPAHWAPLEQHIGERCEEWMWMDRRNGLEYYKHRETRQYLILDGEGGAWTYRPSDGMLVPGDFDTEFNRATFGYSTQGGSH